MERPDNQLNIFDALASMEPATVVTMEPEPGWVWMRCPLCREARYVRKANRGRDACIMTPGCKGHLEIYLEALCVVCAKPVTLRRRQSDDRFCSQKCEKSMESLNGNSRE